MLLNIANTLREGANADIWYDAAFHNDQPAIRQIADTRDAMHDAARFIPELVAALRWALDDIEDSLDPDHAAALAAVRKLVELVEEA